MELPGDFVSYTFPDDGAGGQAYRIWAMAPPAELGGAVGPARAFGYRPESFSRMVVSMDVLDWDATVNESLGLLVWASEVSIGTTDGYVMNYNPNDGALELTAVQNETPGVTVATTPVAFHPSRGPYRWMFHSDGIYMVGRVFLMGELENPIATVLAEDTGHPSGQIGMFVFDLNDAANYTDVYATFDNFAANVPAAGTLRPLVTELLPRPLSTMTTVSPPLIKVGIVDMDLQVVPSSMRLWVNGIEIPTANLLIDPFVVMPGNANPFSGATVTYQMTTPVTPGVTYTNRVTWQDQNGTTTTNQWTYVGPTLLPASSALPLGSGQETGFNLRLVQTLEGQPLANSLFRAEDQLAVPPVIGVQIETNTTVEVINYTQTALPSTEGFFLNHAVFPGIDPAGNTDDFAMEALFHLELKQGYHKFGVVSDDGFQLSTGPSLAQVKRVVLGEKLSGTYNGTFEFGVEADGLYPFRLVFFERGGGAHIELFEVNLENPEDRTLINDPGNPNAIKAWRTVDVPAEVVVESAATLAGGGFTVDPTATVDAVNQTITIPRSGAARFYRIQAANALAVKSIAIDGANVVLTYGLP